MLTISHSRISRATRNCGLAGIFNVYWGQTGNSKVHCGLAGIVLCTVDELELLKQSSKLHIDSLSTDNQLLIERSLENFKFQIWFKTLGTF